MKEKYNIGFNLRGLTLIACLWMSITSFACNIVNPEMTQMQVFLNIPKSFILDFSYKP